MPKKYSYTKGETIPGTFLTYICEVGYNKSHRLIICSCNRCGTMRPFRLEHIVKGRTRSCGCHRDEMMRSGKLSAIAYNKNKDKWWVKKGGWLNRQSDIFICVPKQYLPTIGDMTINQILKEVQ